jgi:hypothetical protein
MPTNASQFGQQFIANAAGTLTEISAYVTGADPQRTSMDTNLTTFNAGGNPVSETHIRGAAQSEFTIKGLFDPVYAKLLREVIAAPNGVAYQQKAGSNAAPGQGDEIITGTYIPLKYTLTYKFGSPATIDVDMKIADGSAAAPAFTQI